MPASCHLLLGVNYKNKLTSWITSICSYVLIIPQNKASLLHQQYFASPMGVIVDQHVGS